MLCPLVLAFDLCIVCISSLPSVLKHSTLSVQATQVRKTNYVPEKGVNYNPDKNHTCTVYAGTMVQQVTGKADASMLTEHVQLALTSCI